MEFNTFKPKPATEDPHYFSQSRSFAHLRALELARAPPSRVEQAFEDLVGEENRSSRRKNKPRKAPLTAVEKLGADFFARLNQAVVDYGYLPEPAAKEAEHDYDALFLQLEQNVKKMDEEKKMTELKASALLPESFSDVPKEDSFNSETSSSEYLGFDSSTDEVPSLTIDDDFGNPFDKAAVAVVDGTPISAITPEFHEDEIEIVSGMLSLDVPTPMSVVDPVIPYHLEFEFIHHMATSEIYILDAPLSVVTAVPDYRLLFHDDRPIKFVTGQDVHSSVLDDWLKQHNIEFVCPTSLKGRSPHSLYVGFHYVRRPRCKNHSEVDKFKFIYNSQPKQEPVSPYIVDLGPSVGGFDLMGGSTLFHYGPNYVRCHSDMHGFFSNRYSVVIPYTYNSTYTHYKRDEEYWISKSIFAPALRLTQSLPPPFEIKNYVRVGEEDISTVAKYYSPGISSMVDIVFYNYNMVYCYIRATDTWLVGVVKHPHVLKRYLGCVSGGFVELICGFKGNQLDRINSLFDYWEDFGFKPPISTGQWRPTSDSCGNPYVIECAWDGVLCKKPIERTMRIRPLSLNKFAMNKTVALFATSWARCTEVNFYDLFNIEHRDMINFVDPRHVLMFIGFKYLFATARIKGAFYDDDAYVWFLSRAYMVFKVYSTIKTEDIVRRIGSRCLVSKR